MYVCFIDLHTFNLQAVKTRCQFYSFLGGSMIHQQIGYYISMYTDIAAQPGKIRLPPKFVKSSYIRERKSFNLVETIFIPIAAYQ